VAFSWQHYHKPEAASTPAAIAHRHQLFCFLFQLRSNPWVKLRSLITAMKCGLRTSRRGVFLSTSAAAFRTACSSLFSLAGRRFPHFSFLGSETTSLKRSKKLEERLFHLVDAKISHDPALDKCVQELAKTPIVIDNGII